LGEERDLRELTSSLDTKSPDPGIMQSLSKYFDEATIYTSKDEKYYQELWNLLKKRLSKRRKLAFLTLYMATKVYSLAKYLSYKSVYNFGTELADVLSTPLKHPDWACWELYFLGAAESVRVGIRRNWYYRLNPRLAYCAKDLIDDYFKNVQNRLDQWVARTKTDIVNRRVNFMQDYIG